MEEQQRIFKIRGGLGKNLGGLRHPKPPPGRITTAAP